jgi:hypothetical protein
VVRGWQPSLGTLAHLVFLFSLPIFLWISTRLAWELHGEILWGRRMIGRQARPCTNLFGMYRWFGVVAQGLDVLFLFILFGDFQSLFFAIFLERFRGLSIRDLVGDICLSPSWFFSLWSLPPNWRAKGLDFWIFGAIGLDAFLLGFPSFLLF